MHWNLVWAFSPLLTINDYEKSSDTTEQTEQKQNAKEGRRSSRTQIILSYAIEMSEL